MRIGVHPLAIGMKDSEESIECLTFLGYEIKELNAFNFALDYDYVIDPRVPEWRGWRLAASEIYVFFPDKMVEWRRQQKKIACDILDTTDDTCYT